MGAVADATRAIAQRLASVGPYPAGRFSDRGIVVCAGGTQIFINAYVLLPVLRETLHCDLPIQLWHIGARNGRLFNPAERSLAARTMEASLIDRRMRLIHFGHYTQTWRPR